VAFAARLAPGRARELPQASGQRRRLESSASTVSLRLSLRLTVTTCVARAYRPLKQPCRAALQQPSGPRYALLLALRRFFLECRPHGESELELFLGLEVVVEHTCTRRVHRE